MTIIRSGSMVGSCLPYWACKEWYIHLLLKSANLRPKPLPYTALGGTSIKRGNERKMEEIPNLWGFYLDPLLLYIIFILEHLTETSDYTKCQQQKKEIILVDKRMDLGSNKLLHFSSYLRFTSSPAWNSPSLTENN